MPCAVPVMPLWGEVVRSGEVPASETESATVVEHFMDLGGIAPRLHPNSREHRENTTGRDTGRQYLWNKLNTAQISRNPPVLHPQRMMW